MESSEYECYRYKCHRERIKEIVDLAGSNNNILEIGVGNNTITTLLKKKNKVTTCDAFFKADIKHDLNRFPFPFKSHSYDVIVCTEVLEHLLHPSKTLKEFFRIIKPDGSIVITVPNMASIKNAISILLLGKLTYAAEPDKKFGHVCDYWFSRLKELVEKNGFKIVRYETTSCYMKFLNISIPRWIYPKRFGEFVIIKIVKA